MEFQESTRKASSQAEEVFASYLDRLDAGEDLPFDTFCAAHPDLAPELRKLQRSWSHVASLVSRLGLKPETEPRIEAPHVTVPPRIALEPDSDGVGAEAPSDDLMERLARRADATRYHSKNEISRGGMGAVLRVWDVELRRPLAMKTLLSRGLKPPTEREVGRFLEEAQITGQLDHPGVVPVHELGLGEKGELFFTMRLIKGRTLGQIFSAVEAGDEEWTRTRALGVILRVCETMAFAHDKGVVHRDLKPANVMVGRFGEVYVVDWGLAHVLGTEDTKDIRLQGEPASIVMTDRREKARQGSGSKLVTMDGDVVGTPAYMSPEQAEGRIAELGPASDVYAVGAILYQLLTGEMPYEDSTSPTPPSPHVIWQRVLSGPPPPLDSYDRPVAPELVAITERAMARDLGERYASMEEMAGDLRAYLEGRVVPVYERGPVAELRKWVLRNRAFAAVAAALVLLALGGTLLYAWNESRRTAEIERYASVGRAEGLIDEAVELGPIHPDRAEAMQGWLAAATSFLETRPPFEQELAELRARALPVEDEHLEQAVLAHPLYEPYSMLADFVATVTRKLREGDLGESGAPPDNDIVERYLPLHEERLEELRARVERREIWEFTDPGDQTLHDQLAQATRSIARLEGDVVPAVQRDLELARSLEEDSLVRFADRWDQAREAIREHPLYGGLDLAPQLGLVPIGPDPQSSLWEFWHVLSGGEPVRDEEGRIRLTDETGLVLVLLPAMQTAVGAQPNDPAGLNYDPSAVPAEAPIEVALAPYFLSKYELTQTQWLRLTGEAPSFYFLGSHWAIFGGVSGTHPVESVTWREAYRALLHAGLTLPSECQWEAGARAFAVGPFHFGDRFSDAYGINFLDATGLRFVNANSQGAPGDDGFPFHAPVDVALPNAFGLHGVHGNVSEFCLDRWNDLLDTTLLAPGTGEMRGTKFADRTYRGGSFEHYPISLRLSIRARIEPDQRRSNLGIRPARSVAGLEQP